MRKLFVVYNLNAGGAERVVSVLASYWARRGDSVAIVVMGEREAPFYPLDAKVELNYLGMTRDSAGVMSALRNNAARVKKLRTAIRQYNPSVVFGVMTAMSVLSLVATIGMKCRVVATEHTHPPQFPLGSFWEAARKLTYHFADLVTAPTQETCVWLRQRIKLKKLRAIANPLSLPLPVSEPILNPDEYFDSSTNLILAAGRLKAYKGYDLLIPAFAAIMDKVPGWALAIVGDGEESVRLGELIAFHRADTRIKLVGKAGNLSTWYDRSQIFVMSSRFEGFGNTLAEAMAQGCACISFDCEVGPSTIIQSKTEGVLVAAGDTEALSKAMYQVIDDSVYRSQLQQNSHVAIGRFSQDIIVSQWDQAIDNLDIASK